MGPAAGRRRQSLVLGFAKQTRITSPAAPMRAPSSGGLQPPAGARRAMIAGRELRLQANRGSHQIHGGTTGFFAAGLAGAQP